MMLAGQRSTWPKLLFIQNRMKIEKLIDEGLRLYNDDGMFIKANGSRPVRRVGPNARSKLGTPPADSKPHSTQDNGVHSRSSSVLEEIVSSFPNTLLPIVTSSSLSKESMGYELT